MRLRLKVIEGPDEGCSFIVEPGTKLIVGRGEASDTKLNDPAMSRIHLELVNSGDSILIADRGSSSGTFLNGNVIETAECASGSKIRCGNTTLIVIDADSDQSTIAVTQDPATAPAKPVSDLVGSKIGPYELKSIVGRGATGIVFKAFDSENDRFAAVKILSPQFTASEEQRLRFVRAMKTMLPIRHDRIIRIYNAGKTGPYCWCGMELIEGKSLTEVIEQIGIEGMLDWKRVWHVAVDVALALDHGFQRKIIHRNVTPANIIQRDSDGVCLLGDFMYAKALEGSNAQQLTTPGQILGEVAYLAPERTMANAKIDTRSDIYGLGATCYALLTGRPPASGKALTEIIVNVRNEQPKPIKTYQLAVNEMFQDIIMKMIAKKPEDRYQDIKSLLAELLRIGQYNNLSPKL